MNLEVALHDLLSQEPRCGGTHVLAIDGRAGAGKTTLALELFLALSLKRSVTVIHLDEIYDGWDGALGFSLCRKLEHLLKDLSVGIPSKLSIYDWSLNEYSSEKEIFPTEVLIIEGVGSAQSVVRKYATATIWLDISAPVGLSRVLERDGGSIADEMIQWQVQEEAHFLADKTRENSDFILSTS
ncbi:MAG: hypothetical protein NTX12_06840 [Actinobacteria bacterium]|nr:hypothetical protein [Actinomycetota bacterium]